MKYRAFELKSLEDEVTRLCTRIAELEALVKTLDASNEKHKARVVAVEEKNQELWKNQLKPGEVRARLKCVYGSNVKWPHRIVNGHCEYCGYNTVILVGVNE